MVCRMFSWHSLGALLTVKGAMDSAGWCCPCGTCPPLHEDCFSSARWHLLVGECDAGGLGYTARSVRVWYEERQNEITILPWPQGPKHPDLNPIENL
ncbi:hypothetical protein AVEN_104733-1 [Araneus ventricosus]|uniref:Tc1-like transposase DDE domain-containing protein n=1 Tax=Araneus ventricosus TaxID=182803 RepID=A0A4Y2NWY4_ARAVE|nr:hypothetical protein AVEN_44002-1 [Araneus ventricosus]GBN44078.1 hypothetical protein AVEN_104733-1 [Araneus ventricosus]